MLSEQVQQLLGLAQRAGHVASGDVAVQEVLHKGRASVLLIAADAGASTRRSFTTLAAQKGIPWYRAGSKAELGHAIGKTPRAVVGVSDPGLAQRIMHLLEDQISAQPQEARLPESGGTA